MSNSHDLWTHDERALTGDALRGQPHARTVGLDELLPRLRGPVSGRPLVRRADGGLSDGVHEYAMSHGSPVLLPPVLTTAWSADCTLPMRYFAEAPLQYFLLSQIKHHGEVNAQVDNVHYQRHLFRMRALTGTCRGLVLDIGCDDPGLGASLFPPDCAYVGLDPFAGAAAPRIIGVGEYLPFVDATFDCVLFNTSLDHILDHHQAIDEAARVLKPGGRLLLCTLVWVERANLVGDGHHFHHFREYEILGALSSVGEVETLSRYCYKDDTHRFSLYLSVRRRTARQ